MPEPSLDWLAVINLLGVVQGLFLSVVFFTVKKGDQTANHLLSLLLFVLAFLVFEIFLGYTGYIQYVPVLVNLEEPAAFLIGPLTYFYTLALLKPNFQFRWKWHGVHLIPCFLQFIGRVPFYLQSNAFKLRDTAYSFHQPVEQWIPAKKIWYFPEHDFLVSFWLDVVTLTFIFSYHVYSIRLIHQHVKKRNESLWNVSDLSLRWLIRILGLFSAFLLIVAFFSLTSEDDTGDIYIATNCSFIFYSLSFYLITHLQASVAEKDQRKKYERSVLDRAMIADIQRKLENFIHTEKPYLNSELTMPLLADQLKVSMHHLSQVINEQYGLNFSDFINQYRIEEMKTKLTDTRYHHFKIEQIAFDTGFNSKSTFQAAFKKFTGRTPSEYRKHYNGSGVKFN
jgi:AraC-like DNA-binding protein